MSRGDAPRAALPFGAGALTTVRPAVLSPGMCLRVTAGTVGDLRGAQGRGHSAHAGLEIQPQVPALVRCLQPSTLLTDD